MSKQLTPRSLLLIGLGYVGLPVAAYANATSKYQATGYDLDQNKIKSISDNTADWIDKPVKKLLKQHPLTVTANPQQLKKFDLALIAVPTPVTKQQLPNLSAVKSATRTAAAHLKPNGLLILESTVNPGVCDEVILPLLAKLNRPDIQLAHCPERIDPGNSQYPLPKIPRVLGAQTSQALQNALLFYQSFIDAPIQTVSNLATAEASKIVENAFRDINIAFVNELAQSFAHYQDLDVKEVIEAATTKPFGFMPHYPGLGVGGHCIPVDPYYLINSAAHKGFEHSFLKLARQINQHMPQYTLNLLKNHLKNLNLAPDKINITLLGLSYKSGIGDLRNSPALDIKKQLETIYPKLKIYDPLVPQLSNVESLDQALQNTQVIVLATAHKIFINQLHRSTPTSLKLIIDGRNCLDKSKLSKNIVYQGIGR